MVWMGNALTRYGYRPAQILVHRTGCMREINVQTRASEADLRLTADFGTDCPALPAGSPFKDEGDARRYSGPLPYTFSHERETNSMVIIQAVRRGWRPRAVAVDLHEATFFRQPSFAGVTPVLASAFCVENVPYRWERRVIEKLP